MTEELKRCPFCNGAAAYWEGVLCIDCGARIAYVGEHKTVANHYAAWNHRVPSPEVTALVEAARVAIGVIRTFHGLGLPKDVEPSVWAAYQNSPEMKQITAALVPFNGEKP